MLAAIEQIEKLHPNLFKYTVYRDPGVTGRLEATVFPGQSSDSGEGIVIHSKASSKKYISENYETFLALLAEAVSK